jgi:hypothetical protein
MLEMFTLINTPVVQPEKTQDHYILGNDGGINITYDNGKTWFKATRFPVGQFYRGLRYGKKTVHVYGSLQDNGTW